MSRSFTMERKGLKCKRERVTRSRTSTIRTSTPKTGVLFEESSISLSEIDSATTTSSGSRKTSMLPEKTGKVNQKKNSRKKRKTIKKRVNLSTLCKELITSLDVESEWETVHEETDESDSPEITPKKHDNRYIKLFEDPSCSPEITREGPTTYETLYDSPIIGSSRLYLGKDKVQRDDLLPINVPSMERDCSEKLDEDEIALHRDSNVKTYLSAKEMRVRQCAQWGQYFEEFYSEYIRVHMMFVESEVPPASRWIQCRHINIEDINKPKTESKVETNEDDPIPPGMMRIRGSSDRNTQRWKRTHEYGPKINKRKKINKENRKEQVTKKRKREKKERSNDTYTQRSNDIYTQPDDTDVEFETAGPHGKRMTLSQFRQKQKVNQSFASSSTQEDSMI